MWFPFSLAVLAACSSKPATGESGETADTAGAAICTEPRELDCVDEMILDLALHDDMVSDGEVSTTTDGDDFVTTIDASAGGYGHETDNPWVYVKFADDGASRVDITDEQALESMDWDMSLRRFIIRLDGGSSGPSCVGAASMPGTDYADVDSVPDGVTFAQDDYYTADCTLINDSSGLEGSPQVVMGPWWEYPGCVATTLTPFLVQLADGRVLKLVVEAYYNTGQDECNANGTPGRGSGKYTIRWRMLQ